MTGAKRLLFSGLLAGLWGLLALGASAQNPAADTLRFKVPSPADTAKADTSTKKAPRKSALSTTVKFSAQDSMVMDARTKEFFLYKRSKVDYGDIKLEAQRTTVNWGTNLVVATPVKDTTGKDTGIPLFTQGKDKYQAKLIKYNFQTKKGYITDIVTQQGEGYLHAETVKKLPNDHTYNQNAQYTTCNLAHPHFHIQATKIKVIPNDKLITGPFHLVIEDIPTPIGFLFGIFPTPKNKAAGIVIPAYGESQDRGFFLRNGGYYFPIKEYAAVNLLGEIYSKGSWGLNLLSNYRLRYRFNGNLDIRYNKRKNGQEGLESILTDYWINWNHIPDNVGGSSRFSASVQYGSSTFNRRNSFEANNRLQGNFSSNISYSKNFVGTPFSLSVNARAQQNVASGETTLELPTVTFGMARQFPFRREGSMGKTWYEKINLSYTFNANNRLSNVLPGPGSLSGVQVFDTINTTRPVEPIGSKNFDEVWRNRQSTAQHAIPISTTVTILRFFNLTPTINYNETWHVKRLSYRYDAATNRVDIDTLNQFGRSFVASTGAALSTNIYGTYFIKGKRVEAIRHTLRPTASFAFTPDLSDPSLGMYQRVQINRNGETRLISPYAYSGATNVPGLNRSGVFTLGLTNTVEMKVRAKPDTSKKAESEENKKPVFEKRMLLDNFSLNTGYDIYRERFKWNNLSLTANTKIWSLITISTGFNFDPYKLRRVNETTTERVEELLWREGSLGRLTNANMALSTSFNPKARERQKQIEKVARESKDPYARFLLADPSQYVDFTIPWNASISYNFTYSRPGLEAGRTVQSLNISGDISLAPKWKIGGSTGYDLEAKRVTFTNLNIYRDLHCWEMRINWIPFGLFQSYSVDINVRASILQDLKLSRRRSWYDR